MDHRTPVLDALNKMAGTLPMHMPGHKRNPGSEIWTTEHLCLMH